MRETPIITGFLGTLLCFSPKHTHCILTSPAPEMCHLFSSTEAEYHPRLVIPLRNFFFFLNLYVEYRAGQSQLAQVTQTVSVRAKIERQISLTLKLELFPWQAVPITLVSTISQSSSGSKKQPGLVPGMEMEHPFLPTTGH